MNRMWEYFKCQQCGACCREIGLPYDVESFFKITELLKMSVEEVIEKYYGKMSPDGSSWETDDSKRIPCPFLRKFEDKHICKIYDLRPDGCRLYPIDTDGGRDGVDCTAWAIAVSELKKEQEEAI